MGHVFISYKREDKAFAKELENQLKQFGFQVWIDEHIPGGKDWLKEIELKIHEAFAVVLIATPEAIKSEWVNYEWIFARGAGIEVVPIHLRTVKKFICRLSDYQLIDFRQSYDWEILFDRINKIQDERIKIAEIPHDTPNDVRQAIEALDSWNGSEREKAIEFLAQKKSAVAVKRLAKCFNDDPEDSIRMVAASALGRIGDPKAIPELAKSINDEQWNIRYGIAKAFRAIKSPDASIDLVKLIGDENGRIRQMAADALVEIQDTSIVPLLIEKLENANPDIRKASAWILGGMKASIAKLPLEDSLRDPDNGVRAHIIGALGEVGDDDTVDRLKTFLDDASPFRNLAGEEVNSKIFDVTERTLLKIATNKSLNVLQQWQRQQNP